MAHTTPAGGFVSGLLHPVLGFDHLAAMVAVGMLGALLGTPAIWQLPICFPLVMALGGVLGIKGVALPFAEQVVAASALILGGLLVTQKRLPINLALALVAAFAVFHGYAHGKEIPSAATPIEYCFGFLLGTGLLHAFGIAIGLVDRFSFGKSVLRGLGLAVAATGVYFLVALAGAP